MPLETYISQTIINKAREKYGARIVIRKRHVTMGIMGDADLYGCLCGRHFEIEVKQPGGMPTPLQLQRLAEWREAGAIAGTAHSIEEAMHILTAPGEEKEPCL